jgi:hypothetical protein
MNGRQRNGTLALHPPPDKSSDQIRFDRTSSIPELCALCACPEQRRRVFARNFFILSILRARRSVSAKPGSIHVNFLYGEPLSIFQQDR